MDDKCIIGFLDRVTQKHYRFLSQSQNHSFENELDIYKNIFVINYNYSKIFTSQCKDGCGKHLICSQIMNMLEPIDENKIITFFDGIIESYKLWIDANWTKALDKFCGLLEEYQLLDRIYRTADYDICFRGRKSSTVLESKDMFHVPFNKRYLIGNQRFSISGQPLLYLGLSIKSVFKELDFDESQQNINDMWVSSVLFKQSMTLYDLRVNNSILADSLITIMSSQSMDYAKLFFNSILASICLFEKPCYFKAFNFHEEYVIPQLLAQTLKSKGLDGILYEGSRINDNSFLSTKSFENNIALFTRLDSEAYDENLWNKLKISTPISYDRVLILKAKYLEKIIAKIKVIDSSKEAKVYALANKIYDIFQAESNSTTYNGEEYINTKAGIMHINLIYSILNDLLYSITEREV